MAGIAGIVQLRGAPPDPGALSGLSGAIRHRGPGSEAVFDGGEALLAQRRRRGIAAAIQDHRFTLVADGKPVRAEPGLNTLGGDEAGRLLAAWPEAGAGALAELDGPFALALWDRRDKVLWLARDPMGVRPLFWAEGRGRVAFCSEIAGLLTLPWVGRDLHSGHLSEYLVFRYVHAPRTLLRDVCSVPAGHALRVDARGARLERWWSPAWSAPDAPVPTEREAAQRIDEGLRRAVNRSAAEGPVGVLLSGGLDSSAILYHARASGRPITAFTVALASDPVDESPFAGRVARVLGADHRLIRLDSGAVLDAIHRCAATMGQPMPTAAGVLQGLVYEAAARETGTLLSGDGGDELLGGHSIEQIASRLQGAWMIDQLPRGLRGAGRILARWSKHEEMAVGAKHFGLTQGIGGSSVFSLEERAALLRDPALVRKGMRSSTLGPLYAEVESDPINDVLHVWQRGWLPEDSLARSDRMAALAGIEIRYPLLDRDMVALCNRMPGGAKVRRRGLRYLTKVPLRRAMEGRIDARLLHRPKRALPAPLDHWLRTEGAAFLRERSEAMLVDPEGLFVADEVRRLVGEHLSGTGNHGLKLWTLLLFDAWRCSLR